MRSIPVRALVLVALVLLPAPCAAQEPVRSFDELSTRLKPGDSIAVRGASGLEVSGTLRDMSASSLTIDHAGLRVFEADDIREVTMEKPRSKGKWAGLGFLAGAAIGAALPLATMDDADTIVMSRGAAALVMGGLLGGVGAVAGLAVAGTPARTLVYRAPAPPRGRQAQVYVAPVVTRRAKGVALSFAF